MSRYSVLIDLNTTGIEELNKVERQIQQIQAQGNKPINLKIDVDGNIKNISSMFDNIEKQATQSGKNINKALQKGMKGFTFNSKDPYFSEFFKRLEADQKNIENISRNYKVDPKDAKQAYNAYGREVEKQEKELARHTQKIAQEQNRNLATIQRRVNSGEFELRTAKINAFEAKYDGYSGKGQETFARAKKEIEQIKLLQKELQTGIYDSGDKKGLQIVDDDQILKLDQLDHAVEKLGNTMKQFNVESANMLDPLSSSKLSNNIGKYIKENTRLTKGWVEAFESLQTKAKNGENVSKEFSQLKSKADLEGVSGKSFLSEVGREFRQIGQFAYTYGAIDRSFDLIVNSVNELKQVDTLLTEISKANDSLSQSDLKNIGKSSFDIAGNYGKKATDFLSGVQEMSRAGYQDALAMAELSTAAQGAGDMTAEIANQYLIATDKAYKYQGSIESLTKVLDGSNNITNKNAVNMTELANGMSIVGSQAASLGVDANETTAVLGTMIASTQQSGSEMARAFRAILLNLQQVTDEEEGIDAEGLNKYEQACNDLNVSLKETKNGVTSLRDPMEVLKDLSVEYRKLAPDDIRRTNLLSSVGGKLRANALNALLEGWDTYEKMLGEYESGGGSMAREAEKTAQSWEGSLNRMNNSWTSFISNFAQSDTMTNSINFLNNIIQGVDQMTQSFGTLNTVMTTLGIFQGVTNGGESTQKSLCIF